MMQILAKSIRIIDYKNNRIDARETPESFDDYLKSLIDYVSGNNAVRQYKSRSLTTEVLMNALDVMNHYETADISVQFDAIANKLLRTEIDVQEKVERLNVNVQKGSLIQALLYIDSTQSYEYLLAKVEHTDFIDDADFSSKTGFQKNKNSYWKSCIINLRQGNEPEYYAKVYTQGKVKYWWDSFLEIDETLSDEKNTAIAFDEINKVLNSHVKKKGADYDYRFLRNNFIAYLYTLGQIDYNEMLEYVLGRYVPRELSDNDFQRLRNKLYTLPNERNFDRQFIAVPNEISAKILKLKYQVTEGVELITDSSIPNADNAIYASENVEDGRHLVIRNVSDEAYRAFFNCDNGQAGE